MNRELLNDNERINYPAQLFGFHFPCRLEPYVYDTAGRLSAEYHGGYWHMYRLENGGFYMAPNSKTFQVSCSNEYQGILSGDAFGIVVLLYTYSNLAFNSAPSLMNTCTEQYHLLKEYMFEHPEAEAILRAID